MNLVQYSALDCLISIPSTDDVLTLALTAFRGQSGRSSLPYLMKPLTPSVEVGFLYEVFRHYHNSHNLLLFLFIKTSRAIKAAATLKNSIVNFSS
jgi:hypothetical protein